MSMQNDEECQRNAERIDCESEGGKDGKAIPSALVALDGRISCEVVCVIRKCLAIEHFASGADLEGIGKVGSKNQREDESIVEFIDSWKGETSAILQQSASNTDHCESSEYDGQDQDSKRPLGEVIDRIGAFGAQEIDVQRRE